MELLNKLREAVKILTEAESTMTSEVAKLTDVISDSPMAGKASISDIAGFVNDLREGIDYAKGKFAKLESDTAAQVEAIQSELDRVKASAVARQASFVNLLAAAMVPLQPGADPHQESVACIMQTREYLRLAVERNAELQSELAAINGVKDNAVPLTRTTTAIEAACVGMYGTAEDTERYLRRRGWKMLAQHEWKDPNDGSMMLRDDAKRVQNNRDLNPFGFLLKNLSGVPTGA